MTRTPATVTPLTPHAAAAGEASPGSSQPVTSQGLPPTMLMALRHQQQAGYITSFDGELLRELKDSILSAVTAIGDKKGFSAPAIELKPDEDGARVNIELSLLDPMGLDAPARRLLERAHEAGLSAAMYGQAVMALDPYHAHPGGPRKFVVTGLTQNDDGFLVRLYDVSSDRVCHASARIVARLWEKMQHSK